MESKLTFTPQRAGTAIALLIEPVWNRNTDQYRGIALNDTLLIEPVWNRNLQFLYASNTIYASFNRTSMESKPR